jgi:ATP-dependent helicase HrpA
MREIERRLPEALLADRMAVLRELKHIRRSLGDHPAPAKLHARCAGLAGRLERSIALRQSRLTHSKVLRFDPELPISAKKDELIAAIRDHQVLIVAGETGSGKTTQLPKLCLAADRGIDGAIGVTQPRRIAALTVGRRIAEELDETVGQTVGVKIRFQDSSSAQTRIKLMTDGILLAEAQTDRFLNQYDTLIVDEAHERSLNIDFILGLLKKLLRRRRDLKVIITSATIDTEKFAQAFGGAPIIEVSGRMYPVRTRYMPPASGNGEEVSHIEQAVLALDELFATRRPRGDILIFMPTEQDIRDSIELIQGRRYRCTEAIPLFARLSAAEQQRVFQPADGIKIVVATNVAETSITIPGIRYVIDTGLARISQYAPRTRTNTLPVVPISQSSADQRQGRCGRVAEGVCIRLFSQEDYDQRSKYTPPEILRANLAEVILRMIALRLGDVEDFPFIDPPAPRSIQDGINLLLELGAIRPAGKSQRRHGRYALTKRGRLMAALPLDPRLASMLLAAHDRGCLMDVAVIAAALSIQDPRERPAEKQSEADAAHAQFNDPLSDFITLLRIWHRYDQTVAGRTNWQQVKQFCRAHFLSFRRMREWRDVFHQIIAELEEHGLRSKTPPRDPVDAGDIADSWYAAAHQSVLSGFLSNVAIKKERQLFQASYNRLTMIFPGSGVFKNPGQWIVAAEMVETSRLFARSVAVIDARWIEVVGKDQCKYAYFDPHWERRREAVVATEQVSLYGLIIDRRIRPYGPVDPAEASEIFIRHALIEGDIRRPLPFMQHNQQLIESVQAMEDRLRRRDLLVDEHVLLRFYQQRLGQVTDIRGLRSKIDQNGSDDFLRLREKDLLAQLPDREALAHYPDRIAAGDRLLACNYHFAPGQPSDGVTILVPQDTAAAVPSESFQWLVPGLLKEKIAALIKGLPKELRKQLVPINDTVQTIVDHMPMQRDLDLATALSRFLRRRIGIEIPAAAWNESQLPDHLRMRIAVTDEKGRILRAARHAGVLSDAAAPTSPAGFKQARQAWERGPITQWDFGDLPEAIVLKGTDGRSWTAYPALEEREGSVMLTAFADIGAARGAHPQGVKALLMSRLSADIRFLKRNLSLPYAYDVHCRYFGGRPSLEAQLTDSVLSAHMAKDIRTAAEFDALLEELHAQNIAAWGQPLRGLVLEVLDAYQTTRMQLVEIENAHPGNTALQAFLEDLRKRLERLTPDRFVALYEADRLKHLPRYIKAIGLRAQRAALDLEKDRAKAQRVAPYEDRLAALIRALTARSSAQKRRLVEDFFWLLEEFKISVFAPEIKTARPVSAKRLENAIKDIDEMV